MNSSDEQPPITTVGSTTYFYIRQNDTWIVAVTRADANPALVFELIHRFVNVSETHLGGIFNEALVRKQDILLYELLDELLDFGYPQSGDMNTLQMMVSAGHGTTSSSITSQATGHTSWRRADIKHSKNECYLDVVETINVVANSHGEVQRAFVNGKIMMKAYLSGMPECQVGLNNQLRPDHAQGSQSAGVHLSDLNFHQCVRLDDYDLKGEIGFIPPNGEFELMSYSAATDIHVPLIVTKSVNAASHAQIPTIRIRANIPSEFHVANIVVQVPLSPTGKVRCRSSTGKAAYEPSENAIVWRVSRLGGGSEA
ncbi:clathrin associated protein complex medium subunit [Malassezia cuniculi]|uniref:Clathrin associated protein complex medium subunit n=1 Tax=Malassezia cuniculi TaxID=948313 RepID=A0AAF0EVC3_9BASI|nr:clathrin associated protein complex medium subunit [Malassezia cuniculi]